MWIFLLDTLLNASVTPQGDEAPVIASNMVKKGNNFYTALNCDIFGGSLVETVLLAFSTATKNSALPNFGKV